MRVIAGLLLVAAALSQPAPMMTRVSAWVEANQKAVVSELLETLAVPERGGGPAEHPPERGAPAGACSNVTGSASRSSRPAATRSYTAPCDVAGAARTILFYCHYDGQPVESEGLEAAGPVHAGAAPRAHGAAARAGRSEIRGAVRTGLAPVREVGLRRQVADRRAGLRRSTP